MTSQIKTNRVPTMTSTGSSANIAENQDDFQAFQIRPVIRDFKLSAELFASNGDIVLLCGKSNNDRQGNLLVSYEIPPIITAQLSSIKLIKVIRLSEKNVTQLDTVPVLKIALLLGDGNITILDVVTLAKHSSISIGTVTLFATWYNTEMSVPDELRICSATKRRTLVFHRWIVSRKAVEEYKDLRGAFELIDTPRALALSQDQICIGYRKSYVFMSLKNGKILKELQFTLQYEPFINCLQNRAEICIQMDHNTIFFNSSFDPLYEASIAWKDIPSAIVQASPYVLSLMSQSIEVCTFNGKQSVPVQQIPFKIATPPGKCRLWMDARTERIYAATSTDVIIVEPISVPIQLNNYIGRYRYDLALILIRAILGTAVPLTTNERSSTHEQSSAQKTSRTPDGHAKGKLDASRIHKQIVFVNNEESTNEIQLMTRPISTVSEQTAQDTKINEVELWHEYYRIGTMNAFQLFHQVQFEQAFREFDEFLTDPIEIICLFESFSTNAWLPKCHEALTTFVRQHRHFSEPNAFVGVKFENALRELQSYLTELRRVFRGVCRQSPEEWIEVQSLVQNRLILRPVRDLLTVVETALLKVYLIDNNNTLVKALLRSQDNTCLPSEVERELRAHHRREELVSFYEKQNRHKEALDLLKNTESLSSESNVLAYLSKLENSHLSLIFQHVEPMIKSALEKKNSKTLDTILMLFIGDPTASSTVETSNTGALRLNPLEVYEFLASINQDFAIKYLDTICLRPELGVKQREVHNRLVYAFCERIKQLSDEFKPLIKEKQRETFQDDDIAASQSSSTSINAEKYPIASPIKKQKNEYETKLRYFLLMENCQCDFNKLEAYFLREQDNASDDHLFSLPYAIVLGKLGRHVEALETFVKNGFYTDAEHYCETIYMNNDIELAQSLYLRLIEFYLQKSNDGSLNETSLKTILRIVNNAAERLDPVRTLEKLPDQLKLNNVKDFIQHSLQTCSTHKRNLQVQRNLLVLKLLRAQSNRISTENHSFIVDSETKCARAGCRQPFTGTQAVMDFDEFVESLDSLPIDLSRNLRLLRELDEKSLALKSECSTVAEKYQQVTSHDEKYNLIQTLNDLQSRRLLHANEKITLANQAYEMVEKHIRRLDDVLEELATQPQTSITNNRKKKRTVSSSEDLNANKKRRKLDKPLNQVQNKTSIKKKELKQEITKIEPVGLDFFPIDPHEPRYCICNQVSFGRMIACDNPHCQIEWFHFACVKLEQEPKGKWFCEQCRPASN